MDAIRLLAGVVGSVYVTAAVSKALSRERAVEFAEALGLGKHEARLVPWALVPFEAAIGAVLIAGLVPLAASIAAALAALGFVVERDRPGLISTIRATALALASIALVGLQLAAGSPSALGDIRRAALGCLIGVVSVAVFGLAQQVAYFEQGRAELLRTRLELGEA